jgi:hypothetical protein
VRVIVKAVGVAKMITTINRYVIVVTTINAPTRAVIEIARDAPKLSAHFIVVGDEKSPAGFYQPGAEYMDLAAQQASGFTLAKIAPTRHYARKNIGYLSAIRRGATVIIETDDDNIPLSDFWLERELDQAGPMLRDAGWLNVYSYFSRRLIWPRGLPLDLARQDVPDIACAPVQTMTCPIQQGLVNQNPDVDAIYRLLLPLPVTFEMRGPILLGGTTWCPFNSQNTTWWRRAFPLLYLPSHCSFRVTDIWRSFVAQRIAAANGWSIAFHRATVVQERNEHDLMKDFEEEVPGYLNNRMIKRALDGLNLSKGEAQIPDNLRLCYQTLIHLSILDADEIDLLEAWILDLGTLGVC